MILNGRSAPIIRKRLLATLAALTLSVNVLLLVQPIYMLQVYDRIVPSASLETLAYLSIAAAGALVVLGLIDGLRAMICSRAAAQIETRFGGQALVAAMEGPRASLGDVQNLRDLGTVRTFIAGRGVLAFLDLPFLPLFIVLLYLIHPYLFFLTVAGAIVLMLIAVGNQLASRKASVQSSEMSVMAMLTAQSFVRNAESTRAMGMTSNAVMAWGREAVTTLNTQDRLNRINAFFSGLSRTLRLGLQVAILGVGGYLVVTGRMTAGMIFASSLISGRALQPLDQIIAGWRGFSEARRAWSRLEASLEGFVERPVQTSLPAPKGCLTLENVVVLPGTGASVGEPILKGVSCNIDAGECLVVMGPSGAGKSTLVRAIIGAAPLQSGAIRVDGSDIRHWDRDELGCHIGYLAQDVDLLPGTIARNIARFDPDARSEDIVEAAEKAQVHELIQHMPNGYDTFIGPGGVKLSGGQRQRVGLARAFYKSPRMLILDEPNSNLDPSGDEALQRALALAHEQGVTVVVVTQRHGISERADKVLMLRNGVVEDFGRRDDVVESQLRKIESARKQADPEHGASRRPSAGTMSVSGRLSPVTSVRGHPPARAANEPLPDRKRAAAPEKQKGSVGEL